jgi:hypothetical protein
LLDSQITNFLISEDFLSDIEAFSEGSFDSESSIEEAKHILQKKMNENPHNKCVFKDNVWELYNELTATIRYINFNEIIEMVSFNNELKTLEFIDIIKCWVTSLLDSLSIGTLPYYINGLKGFLSITNGLTNFNIDEISSDFSILNEATKKDIVLSALNLSDYYSDIKNYEEIVSLLYELKKQYKVLKNVRILPPSRDILIFSKIAEDFFSNNLSEQDYFKWFPIWFWWKLTNLIPLRPSEFCDIGRNALIESDGNYYIRLPRKKQKTNARRIQVIDTVLIPMELYLKLVEYKAKTERFGNTETFISYQSIPHLGFAPRHSKKIVQTKFTNSIFKRILESFYDHVVFGRYNIQYKPMHQNDFDLKCISQKLRPNDTRHLAFINMKKQGYHPVEIARLGGHTKLRSQEHYFNHIQNYVDLEILELITNSDLSNSSNKFADQSTSLGIDFIHKYILRPDNTRFKRELNHGYCTDEEQRCMSEDCWGCEYWRISMDEFFQKQHILENKIKSSKNHLNEAIENLKKLYKAVYENISNDEYYSSDNTVIRKQLITNSKYVEKAIQRYVNLYRVKERIDSIGNTRQEAKNLPATGN